MYVAYVHVQSSACMCRLHDHVSAGADGFTFRTPGVGPIHMDDVHCTGSEARLSDCPHSSHLVNCRHTEDAGATCQQSMFVCSIPPV